MNVQKAIGPAKLIRWTLHHVIWLVLVCLLIAFLYRQDYLTIAIPWLPVSVIGTAVAFYVGFKNNQAYDRMWEARKIWGAIVNSSRTWGIQTNGYVTNQFADSKVEDDEIREIKKRLTYRHIAWLYKLREQLLVTTEWEHANQKGAVRKYAEFYQQVYGVGLYKDEIADISLEDLLGREKYAKIRSHKNGATQIIKAQSDDLTLLRERGLIDDFRHMQMMSTLNDFYIHQGKAERIKKFPLPRQFANMSRIFVGIFIVLLLFSMIPELMKLGGWGTYLAVPLTALVGWVYVMMELVGDYTENPFQGMANDIPMLSLCRVIEIDLREMLGERDLPLEIKSKNGILM